MFLISKKRLPSPTQLLGMKSLPLSKSAPWHGITGQLCPSLDLQLCFAAVLCWISSASTGSTRPKAISVWAVIRTWETLSLSSLLSVVWFKIRNWMISSPLRMSNLDIFPKSVCLPRMSSTLSASLLTLKSGLESRSSFSGDYSELGAQNFGLARTVTTSLGNIVKHGMRTHFITCCASPSFLS